MATNSQLASSLRNATFRPSRAQFSPVAHRATDSFTARSARYPESRPSRIFPAEFSTASATAGSLGRFWQPGLLDRLSAPVTRYRD